MSRLEEKLIFAAGQWHIAHRSTDWGGKFAFGWAGREGQAILLDEEPEAVLDLPVVGPGCFVPFILEEPNPKSMSLIQRIGEVTNDEGKPTIEVNAYPDSMGIELWHPDGRKVKLLWKDIILRAVAWMHGK